MLTLASVHPDVKAHFAGILRRRTYGDLEHAVWNDSGRTFLQGVADDLFRDPTVARRTVAEFDYAMPVQATIMRAARLNAKRLRFLHGLSQCHVTGDLPRFRREFPHMIAKLDPVQFGPWAYVPLNYDRELLAGRQAAGAGADGTEWDAWYFRSDPFKLDGVWSEHGAALALGERGEPSGHLYGGMEDVSARHALMEMRNAEPSTLSRHGSSAS
jgi:hypothetical protein